MLSSRTFPPKYVIYVLLIGKGRNSVHVPSSATSTNVCVVEVCPCPTLT